MDEVWQLERQIDSLQSEIQFQNEQAYRMRNQLAQDSLKKLQEYQAQMESALDRHDKVVRKEYEKRLKEYQNSVNDELEHKQLKMDIEYQQLLISTKEKEEEWKSKTKKLQTLIDELRQNENHKETVSVNDAKKYMTQAVIAYKKVEKKPHEKFFPKRITVYYNAIREARTLFDRGLYEAAIAISISAKSGVSRLVFDIDDALEEWQRQFAILKTKAEALSFKLAEEIDTWCVHSGSISDSDGAKKTMNFWSKGAYGNIYRYVKQLETELTQAQKSGLESYLKEEKSMSSEEIKKHIRQLDDFDSDFDNICHLCKSRYEAACERQDFGEKIIDYLIDEINLSFVEAESHFKAAASGVLESDDYRQYMEYFFGAGYETSDMREWLELVFENSSGTRIFIYIVPDEQKEEVANRIVLYIDCGTSEHAEYARQIYRHICESIGVEEESDIITFAQNIEQLTMNYDKVLGAAGESIEKKIRK